jgi:hypothetical protein
MYQLQKDNLDNKVVSVLRKEDGASIPINSDNTDYQAYLKWVEEGNTPLPADE